MVTLQGAAKDTPGLRGDSSEVNESRRKLTRAANWEHLPKTRLQGGYRAEGPEAPREGGSGDRKGGADQSETSPTGQ